MNTVSSFMNGRSNPLTYWCVGLFLTPIFVLTLGLIEFKFELLVEFELGLNKLMLEIIIFLSRFVYSALVVLLYAFIYLSTYRATKRNTGNVARSLWIGLVSHLLLTAWILLNLLW